MQYFYKYFFKVLNFVPLYKKSALSLIIEALADYFDKVRGDIIYLQNQFIVGLAENSSIPDYASSRGILRSKYDYDPIKKEYVEEFRHRVANAYTWNLLAGKVDGVEKILRTYGFNDFKIKYDGEDGEFPTEKHWAEFDVEYATNQLFVDGVGLAELVNYYKPARSKIRQIRFPISIKATSYQGSFLRVHQSIILSNYEKEEQKI